MIGRTIIPKASGIYLILSKATDRQYVGSSIDLRRRKKEHFDALSKGAHYNSYMQGHANKYGVEDLKIVVVELVSKSMLLNREQYYIDLLDPAFNLCPTAYSRLGATLTEECKQQYFVGSANPMYGRTGPNHHRYGTKHTDETKKKMRRPHPSIRGNNNPIHKNGSWCKGLTKETDERVKRQSEKMKGRGMRTGQTRSAEERRKTSESLKAFYRNGGRLEIRV